MIFRTLHHYVMKTDLILGIPGKNQFTKMHINPTFLRELFNLIPCFICLSTGISWSWGHGWTWFSHASWHAGSWCGSTLQTPWRLAVKQWDTKKPDVVLKLRGSQHGLQVVCKILGDWTSTIHTALTWICEFHVTSTSQWSQTDYHVNGLLTSFARRMWR